MSKTINVGLIGFGMAGSLFHAPFISSVAGFHLKKIRETKQPNIQMANSLYPEAEIVGDAQAIFNDESIDFVVVATPNASHYSLAKEALLASKHVLVDKPFTVSSEEADELIELAKKQNRLLTVFQNRRWDSDYKTVKKVISSNLLGNLVEYEAHYDRYQKEIKPNTWKEETQPGSGLLFNLGSHLIDQALDLFGLPQEVYGDIRTQRPGSSIVDNFEVVLSYENKFKVTLKSGLLVKELGPHFILLGEQGSFTKYGIDVQEEALKAGHYPFNTTPWGIEPENIWGSLDTTYNGLAIKGKIESEAGDYRGLYQNVYKALIGEEELIVKPEQARDVIKVIELAMQSNEQKRTLPFEK